MLSVGHPLQALDDDGIVTRYRAVFNPASAGPPLGAGRESNSGLPPNAPANRLTHNHIQLPRPKPPNPLIPVHNR